MTACDPSECPECLEAPDCATGRCIPRCGTATLKARTTFDDYEAATISFRHATVAEDGQVNNDWDLLFGNDQDSDRDQFTVNMVTDDRSFIVDLGQLPSICDVPGCGMQVSPSSSSPPHRLESNKATPTSEQVKVVFPGVIQSVANSQISIRSEPP